MDFHHLMSFIHLCMKKFTIFLKLQISDFRNMSVKHYDDTWRKQFKNPNFMILIFVHIVVKIWSFNKHKNRILFLRKDFLRHILVDFYAILLQEFTTPQKIKRVKTQNFCPLVSSCMIEMILDSKNNLNVLLEIATNLESSQIASRFVRTENYRLKIRNT